MKAFFKTLFGDWRTILVVAVSLGAAGLVFIGPYSEASGFLLPILLLAGSGWLARGA